MSIPLKPLFLAAFLSLTLSTAHTAEIDPAGDLKTQANKLVKVENPEYLASVKRVAIANFMVDFVSELKYSKGLSGFEAMMGADSNVSIKLVGGNNELFQSITDRFYQQTVEQLKARGIEVVSNEELTALPEFKELASRGLSPLPSEQDAKSGKGLFFTARDLPLYLFDEAQFITSISLFSKPKQDDFLTFGSRFSGNFSAGQNQQLEEAIAKKLGVHLLKVRLTVMGGQLTPDTSFWSSGKVTTRAAASFVDFVTRYAFITPEGKKARVSLKETVHTKDIGELVNITSTGTKAADTVQNVAVVALNVASLAARFGGVGVPNVPSLNNAYASSIDYECRVQPEPVEKTLLNHHNAIAGMFGEKILNPLTTQ